LERVQRYGKLRGRTGENLSFGKHLTGDEHMIGLFIDDGVSDRGHRYAIQDQNYKYVGIAYCPHNSQYEGMVAIAYADEYKVTRKGQKEINRRLIERREDSNAEIPEELLEKLLI